EQADGQKVDARSDIFSFGSVLYEMFTGRRAFAGGSKLSSLSAVLHTEPPPASLAVPDIPLELDRIIARCLKKDPARRWQSMADVKVALDELRDETESSSVDPRRLASAPRRTPFPAKRWLVLGALGLLLVGLASGAYSARRFLLSAPLTFQRLTFRRGDITAAKFGPGNAIV